MRFTLAAGPSVRSTSAITSATAAPRASFQPSINSDGPGFLETHCPSRNRRHRSTASVADNRPIAWPCTSDFGGL